MTPEQKSEVDHLIEREMNRRHIPGLSFAVLRHGTVEHARGFGLADVENSTAATTNAIYQIGSLAKQFAATAVILLIRDGKLSLDTTLAEILPHLILPISWHKITVRQLMNHTTGISNYTSEVGVGPGKKAHWKPYSAQQAVDLVSHRPLLFPPGETYAYSHTNFYLVSQVIAAASGEDFYAYLTNKLFRPLGMDSTNPFDKSVDIPNRVGRYLVAGPKQFGNFIDLHPSLCIGAGGLETSASDLSKWDAALYREWPLTCDDKKLMWTPPDLKTPSSRPYGFGWICDTHNGRRLIWHNGAIPGASCWMGRWIDDSLTVIILTNMLPAFRVPLFNTQLASLGKRVGGILL